MVPVTLKAPDPERVPWTSKDPEELEPEPLMANEPTTSKEPWLLSALMDADVDEPRSTGRFAAPAGMQASSPAPGTLPFDQFDAVLQFESVAPVQVSVQPVAAPKVYTSDDPVVDVPLVVVTVMSTEPAASAGLVAVIWIPLLTVNEVAATDPNFTLEAPVKPDPVMVTAVPPPVPPEFGEREVTTGPG
jgi:hypothetical protein